MEKLKVFTAFSGYDSQCLALNKLKNQFNWFDYDLVGWSEIEENAIKAHNALFPEYKERNYGDISKIDWKKVPDFDLFTYSSPCFIAGTSIITNNGVKKIENIQDSDYVLTHTGKFRKVTKLMKRFYEGTMYSVISCDYHVICTPNHPFYCLEKNTGDHKWIEARNLNSDEYLLTVYDDFIDDHGNTEAIFKNVEIEKVSDIAGQQCYVYNMQVDSDESYTANCIVVHNCTDFSLAGKQAGGEEGSGTRSSLLWECKRCIEEKRPKYLLLENVPALVSSKFLPLFLKWCNTVKKFGYDNFYDILNAKDYGVPQNRERVFLVSIRRDDEEPVNYCFPNKIEPKTCKIGDILEKKVDKSYYMNQNKVNDWASANEKRISEYTAERLCVKVSDLFEDDEENNKIRDMEKEENKVILFNKDIVEKDTEKEKKQKRKLKRFQKKTIKKGHWIERIPTPTTSRDEIPTLMATGYADADYVNMYSVGHFPKLGILEVWKKD
jgi:DNA-cytosine methyltransferase